jgi:hypothetical protein
MPETPEQDGGLSERLLGRGVNVGVVDVGWAQRQYARSADFVAERFGVLGDLNARYGTVDSRGAGTSSALPVAHGTYARAQSETPAGVGDLTTTDGRIQRAAEVSAPRAGEGGSSSAASGGGTGPTLQRKAAGPEPAPAPDAPAPDAPVPADEPAAAPPEKSAPLVSKESAPTTPAAPPSVMRLASETPRARGGDAGASGEGPAIRPADAPRESSGDVTREVSGDAPPAPPASPASTVQTLARELTQPAVTGHDALIQRKPAPPSGPAAEPSGAETSTSTEPPRLPLAREEVTRATGESAPTVMRAARGPEGAMPIQRSAAVESDSAASRTAGNTFAAPETAFAASTSAATPFAATHGGAELSTAGRATVQRAAVHASESPTRMRLSAPEIQRAASLPLAPRMVLRKAVGGSALSAGGPSTSRASMPYVTQTTPPAADALTIQRAASPAPVLMRVDDGADGGGPQSAPVAHAPSNGGGVNLEQITEHVSRVILRRIAVERERRGVRRWL